MTPELWNRLKPLYHAALDLPPEGRTGFIAQMCNGDGELARELSALLAADGDASHTLDPLFGDISLFLPSRPVMLEPGTVLVERFRIVRHLGSGGMGDVYEAIDLQLEQGRIALKTIRPDIAGSPAALARFKEEVLLARKITGPNVCRIHELYLTGTDQSAHCTAFLTMELLQGVTLYDRIEQDEPISIADLCRIAEQLCTALGCIHEAGITHGDLKPRNVMLVPHAGADKVVVMDFGLARATVQQLNHAGAAPDMIAGTPSYMAPEQFEGGEVGPATDIYALGLILYEMATGLQPFAGHTLLVAAIRRSRRPRRASTVRADLPPMWDEIIKRCLEYDAPLRFQSTAEVLHAIKHPAKVLVRVGQHRRIVLPRTGLIAALLAVLLLATSGAWIHITKARQRKLSPEAAHWYALGITALREGSYLKATKMLTQVTERDPTYPLAHAALADAWTELDYTDAAQREMLLASAPKQQRGLSDMERRYIDAVRNTLVRDYSAAAQDYEAILDKLPNDSKAQGYVDLGRIYEKAGKVRETVDSYEKAAQLNADDPAPFLHLGILKSRLREPKEAAQAFDHAEALYGTEGDLDGLAEVAYQRGYAANLAGAFSQAKQHLERSLQIARQIPNVQLEVRSLSQLSSVADNQNAEDLALSLAKQALEEARKTGLEYWTTDARVRIGNAYMGKEDFADAEAPLQEALHDAQQNGHPRLQAFAELNLASLYDQQGRWNEQIEAAQSALTYYQDYGFLTTADQCLLLMMRGERSRTAYDKALRTAQQLITTATRANSEYLVGKGEELLGEVYQDTEQYPDALSHYDRSLKLAGSDSLNAAYQQQHRADVLWRLGRYDEAEALIRGLPSDAIHRVDLGSSVLTIQAQMEDSRGNYAAALEIAKKAKRAYPTVAWEGSDLQREAVVAAIKLNKPQQARADLRQVAAAAQSDGRTLVKAQADLLQARYALLEKNYPDASQFAASAQPVFESKGLHESEAVSLWLASEAAAAQSDPNAAVLAQKSLDIFQQREQSWGNPAFQTYTTRPDLRDILHRLHVLSGQKGEHTDERPS